MAREHISVWVIIIYKAPRAIYTPLYLSRPLPGAIALGYPARIAIFLQPVRERYMPLYKAPRALYTNLTHGFIYSLAKSKIGEKYDQLRKLRRRFSL